MIRTPDDIRAEIARLYQKGMDALAISERTGVALNTVYHLINKLEPPTFIPDPYICSHFGCGHHLTPQEQLYGGRCVKHQEREPVTSIINQYI